MIFERKYLLWRNGHGSIGVTPNHENHNVHDETQHQGLFRGTAGRDFLNCLLLIRRGGDHLRGGVNHRSWKSIKKNIVS